MATTMAHGAAASTRIRTFHARLCTFTAALYHRPIGGHASAAGEAAMRGWPATKVPEHVAPGHFPGTSGRLVRVLARQEGDWTPETLD